MNSPEWAAQYEALYPMSEPKRVYTCTVCRRSTTGKRCGCEVRS